MHGCQPERRSYPNGDKVALTNLTIVLGILDLGCGERRDVEHRLPALIVKLLRHISRVAEVRPIRIESVLDEYNEPQQPTRRSYRLERMYRLVSLERGRRLLPQQACSHLHGRTHGCLRPSIFADAQYISVMDKDTGRLVILIGSALMTTWANGCVPARAYAALHDDELMRV